LRIIPRSAYYSPTSVNCSSSVRCQRAIIEGRLRGNLDCAGTIVINTSGKILGKLSASEIVVEKRCEVQFFRRVRVSNIEIRGRMSGEVVADGMVTIRKNGVLEGNVTAKAINVEKGGTFSGQVVVGRRALQQTELLANESPTVSKPTEESISLARPCLRRRSLHAEAATAQSLREARRLCSLAAFDR